MLLTFAHVHVCVSFLQSGKSTYLRMIGVINVLAHIGCYVPAKYACIRLTDQILTRQTPLERTNGGLLTKWRLLTCFCVSRCFDLFVCFARHGRLG